MSRWRSARALISQSMSQRSRTHWSLQAPCDPSTLLQAPSASQALLPSCQGAVRLGTLQAIVSACFCRYYATEAQPTSTEPTSMETPSKEPMTPLTKHLLAKIMMRGGPITLAEFMQDCLTSPQGGFYMDRDVFGRTGDFITSPEISQMFGEMVGIWAVYSWMQMGKPQRLNVVEMGPGRGTLMADLLRGTAGFKPFASALEVHLVEMSPALRKLQWQALKCRPETSLPGSEAMPIILDAGTSSRSRQGQDGGQEVGVSGWGSQAHVYWHSTLDAVPKSTPAIYIAHEFFDALPVHQFVKDPHRGWVEKLVDSDLGETGQAVSASTQDASHGESATASSQSEPTASSHSDPTASSNSEPTASSHSEPTASSHSDDSASHSEPMSPRAARRRALDADAVPLKEGTASPHHFQIVLSPSATPAAALLVPRRLAGVRARLRGTAPGVAARDLPGSMGSTESTRGGSSAPEMGSGAGEANPGVGSGKKLAQISNGLASSDMCGERSGPADPGSTSEAPSGPPQKLYKALEVCAVGMAAAEALALRVGSHGGAALIIDYGRDEPYEDSLMAIREHKGVGVLEQPGTADLSAWVDFSALRQAAEESGAAVMCHGPISQAHFLRQLGIETRLQKLKKSAKSPQEAAELESGLQRLLDQGSSGMGQTYQVMAITHASMPVPAAFEPTQAAPTAEDKAGA